MKYVIPYLPAIICAEVLTVFFPMVGMACHIFLFVALIVHATLISRRPEYKLLLCLSLAPLVRILSLSMPLASFSQVYWYLIISIPLMAATVVVMRLLGFSYRKVGFSLGKARQQLLIAATGVPFGFIEYQILRPEPLISHLSLGTLVLPVFIMLLSTGFAEEFAFRGVMQHAYDDLWGWEGVIFVAIVFAVLHIGYLSALDMLFVFGIALFFGWAVKKTSSLLGVSLSHGLTNIMLFLIIPFLL
jgi:membrane protease YdiL (CAAX protease family)